MPDFTEAIMRKTIVSFVTLFAAFALAAAPAYADRGYGGRGSYYDGGSYHRGGSHYRGGTYHRGGSSIWPGVAVIGAIAGFAILAEGNRPVYVDPYPAYPVQRVYVEPPVIVAPARGVSQPWYYCQSSAMYYPYTQACPEGWQAVPTQPY